MSGIDLVHELRTAADLLNQEGAGVRANHIRAAADLIEAKETLLQDDEFQKLLRDYREMRAALTSDPGNMTSTLYEIASMDLAQHLDDLLRGIR